MTDLNVDDFYTDAAKILSWLFQQFPVPQTLYVEDISGADEMDEFGMHSKRHMACHACVLWLGEEGYVRYGESIRNEAIDQVVLSGRCFTLLATPSSAESTTDLDATASANPNSITLEQSTPVFALRRAIKQKDSVAVQQTMLAFMQKMGGDGAR